MGVIGLLLLIAVLALLYLTRKLDLSSLPADVRWFYEKYHYKSRKWKEVGRGVTAYFQREIAANSEEWDRMEDIFFKFAKGTDLHIHSMSWRVGWMSLTAQTSFGLKLPP